MKRELELDGRRVDDEGPCYVVAEIGLNHQGQLDTALELMRAAKSCGVDAVKFQKRDNRRLLTRRLYDTPYPGANSHGPTYGAHREALEFDAAAYGEIFAMGRELGLTVFASAFDEASADFLAEFDMPVFKVASADLTNLPLLRHVATLGKPVLLSTGGGSLTDVERAVETIAARTPHLAVLQCTAAYPIENYADMNLRVIETYRRLFPGLVIGLSDHESGTAMAVAAYTLGARIIEKHFTLDRGWRGPDHAFSLTPAEMARLVGDLDHVRAALGDGCKRPMASESRSLAKLAKSLVATRNLPAGHVLCADDLTAKSPGDGLPPSQLESCLGRRLTAPLPLEAPLQAWMLE